MSDYVIKINREDCIACGTYYNIDSVHFESDEEGNAQMVNGKTDENTSTGTFTDEKIKQVKEAEEIGSFRVITLEEK